MNPQGEGPLAGTTVIDLSSVGPAARATCLLADYGARVVKVAAPPGKGPAAQTPPFYAYGANRHMLKTQIDLRDPEGRDAFLALAAKSDVVVESFRPGTVERLRIDYESVRSVNPSVVYCSTSGYGHSGPRAAWAGHDLNYLAVGGYLAMTEPVEDGRPPIPGATIADASAGGMHAALAVVVSLLRRAATGEGMYLDVAVADGVLWLMSLQADEMLATGSEPVPGHDVLSGRFACYANYRTRDDKWLAVAAIEPKFFANLCRALDCEEWIEAQYDPSAQDQIRSALGAIFATQDRDPWVQRLCHADTCVAPVQSIADVVSDPQFNDSGAFVEVKSQTRGIFRQVGAVLAGMAPLAQPVEVSDETSTDTEELLTSAGYARSEIDDLRSRGVVA